MALDEILIPEGAVVFGWDLGEDVIEIETLNKIINIYYYSHSTTAYEMVELDTDKKTVISRLMTDRDKDARPFSEKPPRDFAAVVQAVYSEITAGGVYNKYDKAWGQAKYQKITSALSAALEIAAKGKSKADKISFDPRSGLKKAGLELESGTLSPDQKTYFAQLQPKEMTLEDAEVVVEREFSLSLRSDGYLDVAIIHKLDGEIRWKSEAVAPNEKKAVLNILKCYSTTEDHSITGWVLNI